MDFMGILRGRSLQTRQMQGGFQSRNIIVIADHDVDHIKFRSHTGIILFLNKNTVVWLFKQHNTKDLPMFGLEFVDLGMPQDMVRSMC